MNVRYIIPATVLASFLVATGASAQSTTQNGVMVTSQPVTTSVSSGSNVALGTIQLTGDQAGATITGLPITVQAGGGAAASNLTNCRLTDQNGTAISGSVNPVAGGNVFSLNSPTLINQASGTTTYTIRCDVASGIPSGSTFTLTSGNAIIGNALAVNIDVAPSVPAGSQDVTLANVVLDASRSGGNVTVGTIPVSIAAGALGSTANLTDCRVQHASNLGTPLSPVQTIVNGGQTSFALTVPLILTGGFYQVLALTCDVQPATPVGSTFTISLSPSAFSATGPTGAAINVVAQSGTGPSGLPATTSGTVTVSAAGSAVTPPSGGTGGTGGTGTGTPGVPNTGFGGGAYALALILLGAALVAGSGMSYLSRAR